MGRLNAIGKPWPRIDGKSKVTGEIQYLNDMELPGMLYGKILRSPHAHARIIKIDTAEALALPGVRAVITAKDTPQIKFSFVKALSDKYPLCLDKVRFVGDEVAAVAADDLETAERAIRLIKVEYEPLPGVFDPEEAMQPGAPIIHEDKPSNVTLEVHKEFGNLEEGFKASDRIFEDKYVTQKVNHCCMETQGCIAHWDATDRLTVWAPHQAPHTVRQELARILDIPERKVRVIRTPLGGAFGSRLVTDMKEPIAAILSRKTGRPVKIVNTREEEFTTAKTRYPYVVYLKTGVTNDGRILARQARVIVDNGAYNDKGPATLNFAGVMFSVLYNIPHIKYDGYVVYTNKHYSTAFRGFGNPQMHFACETQLDAIAKALGIDPVELRLRNANQPGDVTQSAAHVTSCGLKDCIEKAAQAAGWPEKRKQPTDLGNGKYRGIGAAVMIHTGSGSRFYGYAATDSFVKISEDGQVTLISPAAEIGQGATTTMAQIVAEVLGIGFDRIRVISEDTDLTPYDLGAWGSRTTFVCGNAARAAAEAVKKEVVEAASIMLGVKAEDIELRDGRAWAHDARGKELSADFGEVAGFAVNKLGYPLSGKGRYEDRVAPAVGLDKGYGDHIFAFAFACQVAEVEVDSNTGRVKVLRVVAAHDTGTTINPLMAEGQIEGSVIQGLGYALTEEAVEPEGVMLNPRFLDYKTWSAADIPDMQVILVESEDPNGPFGAKGIGEPGLVPTAAAVSNAIYHATGKRFFRLPMNAERLYYRLKDSQD